jgi:hypothetical protein
MSYIFYLSLATFGRIDSPVNSEESKIDQHAQEPNQIQPDKVEQIRQIIDSQDNWKDYEKIKSNGAQAKGLVIDEKSLNAEEKQKYDDGWAKYAFNNYASTLIPVNRSIPDIRLPSCAQQKYLDDLPTTSVIMCFHNEAWTVLIRGVYSVINRSPPHLLKEILLVDDFSNFGKS